MTLMTMPPPHAPCPGKRSQFSNSSLSTLESLVLECTLEDARPKEAEMSTREDSPYWMCKLLNEHEQQYEMRASDYTVLKQLPGNDHCADCDSTDTEWASVTFGILICTRCSGQHRSLGTHISRVRSVKMDSWTPEHLERMKAGGNGRWAAFWQEQQGAHQLSPEGSYSGKYDSLAARLYAQQLLSMEEASAQEVETDYTNILTNMSTSSEDSACSSNTKIELGQSLNLSSIWSLLGTDDNEINAPTKQSQQPIAASSPTITYMGRSFPASSVTLKCNTKKNSRSRSNSPLKEALDSDSNRDSNSNSSFSKITMDLSKVPYFGKKEPKKKTSTTNVSDKQPHESQPKCKRSKQKRQPGNVTNRYPNAAPLLYSQQDVLDITGDKDEFAHLQRTLKKNGAITNEVVKQRMFVFVLNRKKKKKRQAHELNKENILVRGEA